MLAADARACGRGCGDKDGAVVGERLAEQAELAVVDPERHPGDAVVGPVHDPAARLGERARVRDPPAAARRLHAQRCHDRDLPPRELAALVGERVLARHVGELVDAAGHRDLEAAPPLNVCRHEEAARVRRRDDRPHLLGGQRRPGPGPGSSAILTTSACRSAISTTRSADCGPTSSSNP